MLVPVSWVKEYVKINIPLKRLVDRLTENGLAVEAIKKQGKEIIFDLEVTPNRPDWLSMVGIAREIAAIEQTKVKTPSIKELPQPQKFLPIKHQIDDPQTTPCYSAVIIKNIKIKPSPIWMQERLRLVGLRPINNLVDITNYVMFELGNPLHAFDYDTIQPKKIHITRAKGGEKFTSVDGITYKIPQNAIIIKDSPNRVIDLCGIKGGQNTGINPKTKTVYLHSPVHPGAPIRLAVQALSLQSDASYIYERGVNVGGAVDAVRRAANLILKHADGTIASEVFDLKKKEFKPWQIKLRPSRVNKVLGEMISTKQILALLNRLDLKTKETNQGVIEVTVPVYRNDLQIEEDLIEEVARLYGYNKFSLTMPQGKVPIKTVPYARDYKPEKVVKNLLKGIGFTEIFTYSLVGGKDLKKLEVDLTEVLKISNPVSAEYEYLRPTLLAGLLKGMALNQPNFKEIKIFELGRIYLERIPKTKEPLVLSGALKGNQFLQAKGAVETILATTGINDFRFEPYQLKKTLYGKIFHSSRTAEVIIKNNPVGIVGEIKPQILTKFGIKGRVVVFDLEFEELVKSGFKVKKFVPLSKYPAIIEDLAFVVPKKTLVGKMIGDISKTSKLIVSVELLDSYKNTRTFRITYQSFKKNLTDKRVGEIRKKIVEKIEKGFGAKLKKS